MWKRFSRQNGGTRISIAIVDTGPLFAAAAANEPRHRECVAALADPGLRPVIPTMVVAETCHMISTRIGPRAEAEFLRELLKWEVESPTSTDWTRIAELTEQYADLQLGGTDASLIATAERLGATKVVTLDRRHFSVVRPAHTEYFDLLPA